MLKEAFIGMMTALTVATGVSNQNQTNGMTETIDNSATTTAAVKTTTADAVKTTAAITEAQAKQIALEHANLAEADVTFIYVKQDYEDGRLVYDVEFYQNTTEYDYEIDAQNGKILSYDYDAEYHNKSSKSKAVTQDSTSYIGIESASKIALQKVSGATSDNLRSIHLDYDDGIAVYEGKIIHGEMEYEFEISATTGDILDWDVESIDD